MAFLFVLILPTQSAEAPDFFNRLRKYALNNGVQVDGDILMLGSGNDTRLAREEKVEDDTGSVSDDSADKDTLASLLQELNSLIGLESVKDDLRSLINLVKIRKLKESRGIKQTPISLHMVFMGNPGTGKTTVSICEGGPSQTPFIL